MSRPCDRLHISKTDGTGLVVHCDAPGIDPERNTLSTAYAALAQRAPGLPGVEVTLRKGIPSGAGLGGGSSDAAALLLWLNERLAKPLSEEALAEVALHVGADTPFFLKNTPCRVRGIGEIIEPCMPRPRRRSRRFCPLPAFCRRCENPFTSRGSRPGLITEKSLKQASRA